MKSTFFVRELEAPADRVWALLSKFDCLDWLPAEHRLEVFGNGMPGTVRIIHREGADPVWEVLIDRDIANRTLTYSVPVGLQIPAKDYSATMRIEAAGTNKTRLHWHSTWYALSEDEEAAAQAGLIHVYNILADGIADVVKRDLPFLEMFPFK